MFSALKRFYHNHESHISSTVFFCGFIFDNITLTRVDLLLDNVILLSYLCVAGLGILIFNLVGVGPTTGFKGFVRSWGPLIIQFAFGALFSGFVVFYTRSASLVASWPFVIVLFSLFIGNEFFRKGYSRLVFQIAIFFMAIFSYAIFFLPVVTKTFGAATFILSGVVSILIISLFVYVLSKVPQTKIRGHGRAIFFTVGAIFTAINVFYFTNIIPPIPLSLKDINIYHFVARNGQSYEVRYEEGSWLEFMRFKTKEVHVAPGRPLYAWSSVFAPSSLKVAIFHEWQYWSELEERWQEKSRIQFPIIGGRDGGYRGYTINDGIAEGLWRVNVVTSRGQLLGRIKFKVQEVYEPPHLEIGVK